MPINILIMGSSHMEATQINMYDSTASLLNKRFSDKEVYNIGTSAHNFLVNVKNLKNALDKYKPTDYLIIETVNVNFSSDDLISIININNETTNKGITSNESFLSKIRENQIFRVIYKYSPFLKLTFHLLNEIKICDDDVIDASNQSITPFDSKNTEKILNTIRDNTLNTNLKVIIVYHPNTTLDSNGSLILSSEKEKVEEFSKLCQDNGIYFLDMSNRFKEEYRKKYILPYGFNNTSVGSGHLNKYGHEMIADELYKLIKEVE